MSKINNVHHVPTDKAPPRMRIGADVLDTTRGLNVIGHVSAVNPDGSYDVALNEVGQRLALDQQKNNWPPFNLKFSTNSIGNDPAYGEKKTPAHTDRFECEGCQRNEAIREAVEEERERLAELANQLGAFYKTTEPNPDPPGGEVVSYHDFADAIRKGN
ncbi:hypothetical protein VT84_09300 [Gemmata sp. SH-PL17]|uniref:hypothetical protein n=1 Tax=Gemmata sp. SH-PL17 TaxID=1630693 RepID=UPI00078C8A81|nr:hypothetical protein [Gemmata sp. SH-PL17]AMV24579.1 hypothetical protein VT84_09300 [Gemmata sp. SH-PL17]